LKKGRVQGQARSGWKPPDKGSKFHGLKTETFCEWGKGETEKEGGGTGKEKRNRWGHEPC